MTFVYRLVSLILVVFLNYMVMNFLTGYICCCCCCSAACILLNCSDTVEKKKELKKDNTFNEYIPK